MKKFFLYPSSIFVSKQEYVVTTILGSCVAICLWDKYINMGGINHFMLPLWKGNGLASPRYGNIAIERIIKKMISMGSKQENLKAKIFGGAKVIGNEQRFNIGERNISVSRELLKSFKIPIIVSNVGGTQGRKIFFFTQTGQIRMKLLKENNFKV